MRAFAWFLVLMMAVAFCTDSSAQLDPEKRRLLQIGYNQPLEGRAPIAAYGFFYYNNPEFLRTNLTLRAAIAPIYLDSELGISGLLGPNTDLGIGLAGGGFADSYAEIREGVYRREESFLGHGGEVSASIYHRFNPDWRVPLWGIVRPAVHHSLFEDDSETAPEFVIPDDLTSYNIRTGLRLGGREPNLSSPVAFEVSLWYQGLFREDHSRFGVNRVHAIESQSHLFWGRTFLKYTFEKSQQYFDVGFILGTSIDADRLSAYRLGGILPFVSEFPLSIPGYYFQELTAERFALLNAEYSLPITPGKAWRLTFYGAGAAVEYLPGLEQSGRFHSGLGAGVTYVAPSGAWLLSLIYGHGFQALRKGEEGSNQIGLMFQLDFEATRWFPFRPFQPRVTPYGSRAGERLFK